MKVAHKVTGKLLFPAALSPGAVIAAATFEQLDANEDGQLGITEAGEDSRLTTMGSTADVDQDGVVSRAGFSAFERLQEKAEHYDASPGEESDGTSEGGPGADSP
jgi:hypothetical protein